jgi:hypothetical protein
MPLAILQELETQEISNEAFRYSIGETQELEER